LGRRHLANRRRLTDPVDSDKKPHGNAIRIGRDVECAITSFEESNQLGAQGRHQAIGRSVGLKVFENLSGSRNTHVTSQKYFFDEFELLGGERAPTAA
jgi:hypothetical protein